MPTRQGKREKSLAKSLLRKSMGGSLRGGSKANGDISDEDSVNDTASVVSIASECRSLCDEGEEMSVVSPCPHHTIHACPWHSARTQRLRFGQCSSCSSKVPPNSFFSYELPLKSLAEEVDEQSQEELFEEKLKEAIDGCTQKSAAGRVQSLESCCRALAHKFAPDFLLGRRMTVSDAVERCLRKGKGPEQSGAARLASLLCLQLGSTDDAEAVFADLRPALLHATLDTHTSCTARARCCASLGLCNFLCGGGDVEAEELMETLEGILTSPSSLNAEQGELASAAASSWALMLTLLHPQRVALLAPSRIPLMARLLDSSDLELRIAAGECLALLLEMARESKVAENEEEENDKSDDFLQLPTDLLPLLADKLHQLATDSHKYRAKKDRKQQRSSFRDIVRGVEDQEAPCVQVRFGPEALLLNSWRRKRQYDAVCQALGSGTNIHLATNDLVRDIFELGSVLPFNAPVQKITKFERHMMNVSAFKARTLSRSRNRDKRSVVVAY